MAYSKHVNEQVTLCVIRAIQDVKKQFPDLRVGQLIINAVGEENLYHIQDNDMVVALYEYMENHCGE